MLKVHILDQCPYCHGQAQVPIGEGQDYKGRTYTRYAPCQICEGTGQCGMWISLPDFLNLLKAAQCKHEDTSHRGEMHFSADDVWDDIHEVCDDCGADLDRQTLGDFIQDDN